MKVNESSIRSILRRWRPRLGLDERWHIEVNIYPPTSKRPKALGDDAAAIEPKPEYFQATLHVNTKACEEHADGLEAIVLHELLHVVTWPISIAARDGLGDRNEATWRLLMEQMVETITRALLVSNADASP